MGRKTGRLKASLNKKCKKKKKQLGERETRINQKGDLPWVSSDEAVVVKMFVVFNLK